MKQKITLFISLIVCLIYLSFSIYNYVLDHSPNLYIVQSNSMYPYLLKNDVILTHKKDSYEENDVITYFDNSFNRHVTHRVISVKSFEGTESKNIYTLKGDNNGFSDYLPVNENEIIGEVVYRVRFIGILFSKSIFLIFIYFLLGLALSASS